MNEVEIIARGPVGCGKSAVLGEIEIALRALGLRVSWRDEKGAEAEKYLTHADWVRELERTKPIIVLTEQIERSLVEPAQLSFQQRVQPWMLACFGEMIAGDREERNHRFLEEALELVQATGCTASEAHQLADYVYSRPVGEPAQEVGGTMVTLAALCLANDLDMHTAAETELARIWTNVEQIRAKQAAKPKHSPLPAALHQHAQAPDLFKVKCWVEGEDGVLCEARAGASEIKNPEHAFVRLSAVLKLVGVQQHAQAALSDERESQTIAQLRKSLAGWQEECHVLRDDRDTLRQRLDLQALHQKNDVWYWQGDGTDYPESISNSMAVVIRGDQLHAILATRHPAPDMPRDGLHLQKLPLPVYQHPELGDLFDRFAMHSYAVRHMPELPAAPVAADVAQVTWLPTVRDLDRISIQFGADLAQMHTDTINGIDYLQREFAMQLLMGWRREWDANVKARPAIVRPPANAAPVDAKPAALEQLHTAAAQHKMALVPLHLTRAMIEVLADEWEWEDLLAAAEAITDEQYAEVCAGPGAAQRRVEELEYLLEAAQPSAAQGEARVQGVAGIRQWQERTKDKGVFGPADAMALEIYELRAAIAQRAASQPDSEQEGDFAISSSKAEALSKHIQKFLDNSAPYWVNLGRLQDWLDGDDTYPHGIVIEDSERDSALRSEIDEALRTSQTGQGSYGPNYDGQKLAAAVRAALHGESGEAS